MDTITIIKGEGVKAYRLLAIKQRIKMEKLGLKFRGGSTRAAVAAELGLKSRDSHQKFIEAIDKKLAEMVR
jgi:hypothetical protein